MKKILFSFMGLLALMIMVGCSSTTNEKVFSSTKDVYAFEAMSSISLMSSMEAPSTTSLRSGQTFASTKLGYSDEVTEEEITEINKYLGIMEQMLVEGEALKVVDEVSDRSEYAYKLVITTKDIDLNAITYTLYYNEVLLNDEEEEIEEEDTEEDVTEEDDDDDDKDEDEIESSLEGIMIIGDKEYVVNGKKEIEEDEMKVEFTSKIDDNNWVKVTQKTEDDETKFKYEISENGVVTETEIKIEKEDDETKLQLKLEQGEEEREYEFKLEEEDGKKVIKIEIDNGDTKIEVKVIVVVDEVTGEESYEYRVKDTDKTYQKNREIKEDDDEEDLNNLFNESFNQGYFA